MPYVQIHTIKGMLNPSQKQLLLERIADVLVDIEGEGDPEFRKSIWINIQETEAESWSMSGFRPSTRQIEQFLAVRNTRASTQEEAVK